MSTTSETFDDISVQSDHESKEEENPLSKLSLNSNSLLDSNSISNQSSLESPKQSPLLLKYSTYASQGRRSSMEDEILIEYNFTVNNSLSTSSELSLFCVFDGHSGNECSKYCRNNILNILKYNLLKYKNINIVFYETIKILDNNFSKYESKIDINKQSSGSTACILLIDKIYNNIYCCNVGDSRCILISNKLNNNINNDNNNNNGNCYDDEYISQQLSIEHKPTQTDEYNRIKKLNGFVSRGYLMGTLGVSRAIGDIDFKKYPKWKDLLISKPDITSHKLSINDEYILLGCDGLFDVFSNNEIANFIKKHENIGHDINDITSLLVNNAINIRKSTDNVSIILIKLNTIKNKIDIPTTPLKLGRFTVSIMSDNDTDNDNDIINNTDINDTENDTEYDTNNDDTTTDDENDENDDDNDDDNNDNDIEYSSNSNHSLSNLSISPPQNDN